MMFASPTQRANRRRLFVFGLSFVLLLAVSLGISYSRPPVYLASGRAEINPGAIQVESATAAGGTQGANSSRSLLSEMQVLTSRPLLQQVLAQLSVAQQQTAAGMGSDPVAALQAGLEARVSEGTSVVLVSSRGPDANLASALVNGLLLAYKDRLERDYQATVRDSLSQAQDEVDRLGQKLAAKRRQIEEFRLRHNIVSLEREENELLGRLKGQTDAQNKALERLAVAEGKVLSARQTLANARPVPQPQPARPSPALAAMEQRVSLMREELAELNRQYTPAYLAIDPKARALRDRLAELERQISQERQAGQRTDAAEQRVTRDTALTVAEEELTAARAALERLHLAADSSRAALNQFAARFNEYRGMNAEQAPIEALFRDANQRRTRLEAGERARRPSVRILEPAIAPTDAWQPNYTRDAWMALAGSFGLALVAMWLVELFNKDDVQPTLVVAQGPVGAHYRTRQPEALAVDERTDPALEDQRPGRSGAIGHQAMLTAGQTGLRELEDAEVAALLDHCSAAAALFVHLMLRGLSAEEALALRACDLEPTARLVRVAGTQARNLSMDAGMMQRLAAVGAASGRTLVDAVADHHQSLEHMAAELLYAAHDAGIGHAHEITPPALRHTCATFLARQGIRMAELAQRIGALDASQIGLYSDLAGPGKRLTLSEVDLVPPAAQLTDPG